MDPELRRALIWMSRILSWLFALLSLAIAVTALPREWTLGAHVPRPYTLCELELIERVLWLALCAGATYYFHTLARGFGSGRLNHFPFPRLPWEREP